MSTGEPIVATIPVEVELDKTRFAALDLDEVCERVSGFADQLLRDLAIPARVDLGVGRDDHVAGTFAVRVHGERCRMPHRRSDSGLGMEAEVAEAIIVALHENRGLLLAEETCERVREAWSATGSGVYMADLDVGSFRAYLLELVRRSFRVDRGHALARSGAMSGVRDRSAVDYFEEAVRALESLCVSLLHHPGAGLGPGAGDDKPLDSMLAMMQDGLFYELGVRVPQVKIIEDKTLEPGELRVRINDRRLPPFRDISGDEFLVNDTVERLRLLGIEGRLAINPVNGNECALVKDDNGKVQACEAAGLTVWGRSGYRVLALSAAIRRNAGSLVTIESLHFDLDRLKAAYEAPVDSALDRFGVRRLIRIFRLLLDEEFSLRDLRGVLEALLSIKTTLQVDLNEYIVFVPHAMNACWTSEERGLDELTDAEYVESVRSSFKRYITHKYTRGTNTLIVYLLDRAIESRITEINARPLSADEQAELLNAVIDEVRTLPPTAQSPVVLTTTEVRRPFRALVEREFPQLAVLSYQELALDANIQPIARISLD